MEKIKVAIILEILGRPAEHIKEALTQLIDKMVSEKGVSLIERKIHETTLVKDTNDLYTTFAEVSLELDSLANLFGIMFVYMPAHVEITSPENLNISNLDLNDLGNKLLGRLHEYDAIAKKLVYEKDFLLNKLKEFAPHLFKEAEQASPQEQPQQEEKPKKKSSKKPKKQKK